MDVDIFSDLVMMVKQIQDKSFKGKKWSERLIIKNKNIILNIICKLEK